jgi:hypothetical protein
MPESAGIDLGALTRRVEQLGGFPHFPLSTYLNLASYYTPVTDLCSALNCVVLREKIF